MNGVSVGTFWESRAGVQAKGLSSSQRRVRREKLWAWSALLVLIFCWDAASRLDQHPSVLRERSSCGCQIAAPAAR